MRRLFLALLVPALSAFIIPVQAQTSPAAGAANSSEPAKTAAPVPATVTGLEPNLDPALDPAPQIIDAANSAQARYAQALDDLAVAKEELQQASDDLLTQRKAKGNTALLETDPVLKAAIAPFKKEVEDSEKELVSAEGSLRAYSLLRTSARHGGVQIIQVPAYVPDGAASEPNESDQPIVGKPAHFKKKAKTAKAPAAQAQPQPVAEPVKVAPVEISPIVRPASEDAPEGPHSEFAAPQG